MKNVLVLGYNGYNNCGDDAILISITKTLRSIDPRTKITVLSNNPKETEKLYDVKAIYRFNPFGLLWSILKCDTLICGGGTLLQDGTSTRSIIYYLAVLWASKLFGKSTMLYSNGIGPISRKTNLALTKIVIDKVDTITFREESSKNYLENIGIKSPDMSVTADPAFGLDRLNKEDYKYVFENNNIPMDKEIFGISVREWKKTDAYYVRKVAKLCDYIVESKDMNIVFLNLQNNLDKKISEKIMEKMSNKSYMITEKLLPLEILGVTANFKAMISMRLHGIIFAAKQRVPVAGIIYDPKVDYYLNTLELPAIGSVDEINIDDAIVVINGLIDNNEEYVERLDKVVKVLEEKESMNKEKLIELLKL